MLIRSSKYLVIIGLVVFLVAGIYKVVIGQPDYTLFIIPMFMWAFYMRLRGMDRANTYLHGDGEELLK